MTAPKITEETPLYSSRIVDNYIKLLKRKYSHVNVNELLRAAKMTSYEVADEAHWFTQKQVNLFHEKLSQYTQNENIAREAGRYAASPDALGVMRQYVLGMVDPSRVYEMIGKTAERFTKSTTVEPRKIASNRYEIVVTPNAGTKEKSFQCENRHGFFEAITMIFTNRLPKIEHPECIFRNGKVCRYIISWEKSISSVWKKIRTFSALILLSICLMCLLISPVHSFTIAAPISTVIVLFLSLIGEIIEKREIHSSLNHLKDSSDRLVEQIEVNYNNVLLTNEIGLAISKQTRIEDILKQVIQISENRLNYDRGMILLSNQNKTRLVYRAGYGYSNEQMNLLKQIAFRLDRPESKGIFVVAYREQRPFLVNDIDEIQSDLSPRSLAFSRKLGAHSFMCLPIICDGNSIGIMAVDNVRSKKPLVQSDMSLLIGIASVLGVSIRNAQLIEARERQFRSILQTLAASIDARDPLTSGHSEKVTEYALGICQELNLSNEYREMIRVAALLHDYGKIGVPDAILMKPGRLTLEEYEVVKTHSRKTKEILEQINFEGIYSQVPEIAGAHHEKIDGSGYPDGISGDKIPLGAKIIAVADFFDAITSQRHYRDPMPLDKAFNLLHDDRGFRFDERVVDAFVKYIKQKALKRENTPEQETGNVIQMRAFDPGKKSKEYIQTASDQKTLS